MKDSLRITVCDFGLSYKWCPDRPCAPLAHLRPEFSTMAYLRRGQEDRLERRRESPVVLVKFRFGREGAAPDRPPLSTGGRYSCSPQLLVRGLLLRVPFGLKFVGPARPTRRRLATCARARSTSRHCRSQAAGALRRRVMRRRSHRARGFRPTAPARPSPVRHFLLCGQAEAAAQRRRRQNDPPYPRIPPPQIW